MRRDPRRRRRRARRRPASSRPAAPTTDPGRRPPPPAVTIGWSGDAVPASVDAGLPPDPGRLFGAVTPYVRAPDVMIGNLEGTLTDVAGSSKCGPGSTDCVAFRAPPAYGRLFARAGYDVLSLANNHAHDHGEAGLAQTRQVVRADGDAHHRRPGRDRGDRTVRGVRVAVVGFAPYGWAAPLNDPAAVRSLVPRAAARADIVIVVFHGGAEGSRGAARAGRPGDGVRGGPRRPAGVRPDRGGGRRGRGARRRPARGPRRRGGRRPPGGVLGGQPGRLPRAVHRRRARHRPRSSSSPSGPTALGRRRCSWPTRQVQPGYPEPDPDRAAIALVRAAVDGGLRRRPRCGSARTGPSARPCSM